MGRIKRSSLLESHSCEHVLGGCASGLKCDCSIVKPLTELLVSDELGSVRNSVLFKEYDIRGLLSDDFVKVLGFNFGSRYGSVVVMSDSKESSRHYARVFSEGVNAAGFDVIDCGVGPTDMCSVAGVNYCRCSVMFTASHLSDKEDGIKFHDKTGLPFSSESIKGLAGLRHFLISDSPGSVKRVDFVSDYSSLAIKRFHDFFKHDLSGLRVIIDLKNGSGITHSLLERLGAKVTVVNTGGSNSSDGVINSAGYDVGFIHDFDADRVVLVNESGIVNGSLVACMLADLFKGVVVASIDSSVVLAGKFSVVYSRVGDPFVVREVLRSGACLGVEPSGHYTDPCFALTSSGSLFALLIAGLASEESINSRLSKLPRVVIEHGSVRVSGKAEFMKSVVGKVPVSDVISGVDGLKFKFKGGTALVRPSGTEPIVRFQLENPFKQGEINELMEFFK